MSLLTRVQTSKNHLKAAHRKYQATELLTLKLIALDHQFEPVTHVGGIESLHAMPSDATHKQFKIWYALSSRRKHCALNEALTMQDVMRPAFFCAFPCLR